jgi:3-oxoacyl-[acyl-carrier protein] reductase
MNTLLIGGSKGLGATLKKSLPGRVLALERQHLDLGGDESAIYDAVDHALEELGGRLDRLVVSAGKATLPKPTGRRMREIEGLFAVNVFGPMAVFRATQRALLRSKGRACIVTSTVARRPGSAALAYYAATKGAVNTWVMSEGRRQAEHGVALFAVSPGWFESPMTDALPPAMRRAAEKAIPAGRFGTAEEVAAFTRQLLDAPAWTLFGQVFECSGGA